jgi:hypothetical protein
LSPPRAPLFLFGSVQRSWSFSRQFRQSLGTVQFHLKTRRSHLVISSRLTELAYCLRIHPSNQRPNSQRQNPSPFILLYLCNLPL